MSGNQAQTDITTDMKKKSVELRDEIAAAIEAAGVPRDKICEIVGLPKDAIYGESNYDDDTDLFDGVSVLMDSGSVDVLVLPDLFYVLATPSVESLGHWERRVSSVGEAVALVRQAANLSPSSTKRADIPTTKAARMKVRDEIVARLESVGVPKDAISTWDLASPSMTVTLAHCETEIRVGRGYCAVFTSSPYDERVLWDLDVTSVEEIVALVRQAMDYRSSKLSPQTQQSGAGVLETLCLVVGPTPTPEFGANGDFLGFDTRWPGTHHSTGQERAWSGDVWCKPDDPCVECDPPVPAERLRRLMFGDLTPSAKVVAPKPKQGDSDEPDLMDALQASIDRAKASRRSS